MLMRPVAISGGPFSERSLYSCTPLHAAALRQLGTEPERARGVLGSGSSGGRNGRASCCV